MQHPKLRHQARFERGGLEKDRITHGICDDCVEEHYPEYATEE